MPISPPPVTPAHAPFFPCSARPTPPCAPATSPPAAIIIRRRGWNRAVNHALVVVFLISARDHGWRSCPRHRAREVGGAPAYACLQHGRAIRSGRRYGYWKCRRLRTASHHRQAELLRPDRCQEAPRKAAFRWWRGCCCWLRGRQQLTRDQNPWHVAACTVHDP